MPFAFRQVALGSAIGAALLLFSAGCSLPAPLQPNSVSRKPCNANDPADLTVFPQHIEPYLENMAERKAVLPLQETYKRHYYSVWAPDYAPEPLEKVKWPFEVYTPEDAYGENLRPLPQAWFYAMMLESAWERYGSVGEPVISLKRLNLRNFPTAKPLFHNPCTAGEGFPFDYLQNSTVFANEPLYLSHYSKSGAWAYVLTSYATGWVPSDSIGMIDAAQRAAWQKQPLLALLGDNIPVHTSKRDYLFASSTGMLLPLQAEKPHVARVAIARGVRGIRTLSVPLSDKRAAPVPMRWSRENVQRVISAMMKTKYGWGGLYGERDCSSTIRDMFAPFGIWLPRNSFQQSGVGRVVSLKGLDDEAKRAKILAEAKPFETLFYLKGHIMLYLGLYSGEPAVLHTIWGIKTRQNDGTFGRFIIGKTVITSLRLGRELDGYRPENALLHRVESMNFIFEKE